LVHLRRFGELLAKSAAARLGVDAVGDEGQSERLRRLGHACVSVNVLQMFHSLRKAGNDAAHVGVGSQQEAFTQLKIARELGIWFQRSFGNDRKFNPGPFVPPRDLQAETTKLAEELATLREAAAAGQAELDAARAAADAQAREILGVAAVKQKAQEERELWESLALESAAQRAADRQALEAAERALEELRERHELELAAVQAKAAQASTQERTLLVEQAAAAANVVDLDEATTRLLIDQQLRDAGWQVALTSSSSRPRVGSGSGMLGARRMSRDRL